MKQINTLPNTIIGINRTESIEELAKWYSLASVFVNPTTQDNFPTTNIEALACGTPVITYNTGGSPEAIDKETGVVVDKGDIKAMSNAISEMVKSNTKANACRQRAEKYFNKEDRYKEYLSIYNHLITQN
jgi:glycosyltransferase involved in cell wall biosynthesis